MPEVFAQMPTNTENLLIYYQNKQQKILEKIESFKPNNILKRIEK